jgi:hypothetical protein
MTTNHIVKQLALGPGRVRTADYQAFIHSQIGAPDRLAHVNHMGCVHILVKSRADQFFSGRYLRRRSHQKYWVPNVLSSGRGILTAKDFRGEFARARRVGVIIVLDHPHV